MVIKKSDHSVKTRLSRLIDSTVEYQQSVAAELFDHLVSTGVERSFIRLATDYAGGLFDAFSHRNPGLARASLRHWQSQLRLFHNTLLKALGADVEPLIEPQSQDHRFDAPDWDKYPAYDFLKQSYLLLAQYILQAAERADVDAERRKRFIYYTRQLVNALAPSNFPLTNPEVLRRTLETQGENIIEGLQMLLEDRKLSSRILNVCMSQPGAFKLGENIACTPGQVIAENKLMQLIQYAPATEQVFRTPILIVPSWVNKYYILDLTPTNSFVRWLVGHGHTVFMISWINPDARHREANFSDYLLQGPLAALAVIETITGQHKVSAIGYCLGGVLLAATLAYCAAGGERRFKSATYLAASIDFSDPGDISMFIDEETVETIERQMSEQGYLDGRLLAAGFNLLRENDLYWSYYITNYLKGERPAAFDLMHWNTDNTNVPAANHSFVLRELHLHNRLMLPGAIKLDGRPIDLASVKVPTYVLATEKDHIAKWRSTYTAATLQRGNNRYVLAGSGHIAGVINPPEGNKYYYFVNDELPPTPEQWLEGAAKLEGSWWLDWQRWQRRCAGPRVPAREIDAQRVIEPAPGRYALRRIAYGDRAAGSRQNKPRRKLRRRTATAAPGSSPGAHH